MSSTIRVVDLFAGAGGLSLGFEMASPEKNSSYEMIKCLDFDPFSCKTLRTHFRSEGQSEDIVIEGDITDQAIKNKLIREAKGKTDLIIGGPPCQSFSLIGPRSGYGIRRETTHDYRDTLWVEYIGMVESLNPKFILLENVKGILSKRDREGNRYIDKIIKGIEKLGYDLTIPSSKEKYRVLNAADYGVPQTRERVFLIANRIGEENPESIKTDEFVIEGPRDWVTIQESIGDLPKIYPKITKTDLSPKKWARAKKHNQNTASGQDPFTYNKNIVQKKKSAQAYYSFVRTKQPKLIQHHVARPQQSSDIELFKLMLPGETAEEFIARSPRAAKRLIKYDMKSFCDKYRKQNWDFPSTTIFAHMSKDGNRFIHPDSTQHRTFSVREAARIQTFPDFYCFEGPNTAKYRQIGNSVPPLLAKAIAEKIAVLM